MDKLISIIVPVYNVEKCIGRCLDSLLNQTYSNIEIILINDGSTDNSFQVCKKYALLDSRIKLFDKKNEGVSATRNFGLKCASGDFIAFVDSDDWISETMYEDLLSKQKAQDYDLVFCRFNKVYGEQIINVKELSLEEFSKTKNIANFFFHSDEELKNNVVYLQGNVMGSLCRVLYKKTILEGLVFYEDIKYMEDVLFLTKLLSKEVQMAMVDKYLYNYYMRESSATHSMNFDIVDNCIRFVEEIKGYVDDRLLSAIKFFCFSECLMSFVAGNPVDFEKIKHWNTKDNYKANKKLSKGFKVRIKFYCVRHNLIWVLKILKKIKKD